MELNIIMKALEKAEQKHKEQEEFWNLFNEIWSDEVPKQYSLNDEVDQLQIDKIQRALDENDGNRTYAAKSLGIKRETLLAKMKRYCLNCHKS
jgi:transcriptional regulator with GAF, ATPase, and Fis domain